MNGLFFKDVQMANKDMKRGWTSSVIRDVDHNEVLLLTQNG